MKKVKTWLLLPLTVVITALFLFTINALATNADGIADQLNAISGLEAVVIGNDVFVTGTADSATLTSINLNIDPNVKVIWQADFAYAVNGTYLLNVSGSGAFELSACTLANPGTGGALNITGAGMTVTITGGGAILSDRGGNPILVSANNVTVNVLSGGVVRSMSNNGNAAIQIGSNLQGVKVDVNGGTVISESAGYAINDGAGTGDVTNNTEIIIRGGSVIAETACAIHSTGANSVTTVSAGTVSNAAGNNVNPAIYMNAGSGTNVIINGTGAVLSTSQNGYAVQTTGNVTVAGSARITVNNGRAINLVGLNSVATISGGEVRGTGTNVISTATTNVATVTNAGVIVNGGTVTSGNGNAINITGANSNVVVSSGRVTAGGSGNAINAESTAVGSVIIAGGGSVSSVTGYAIRNDGAGSNIYVSDTANGRGGSGGPGGQVSVLTTRGAIRSNGTVTVNGGIVFAFGNNASSAIIAPSVIFPSATAGQVCVWNQAAGRTLYAQGTSNDLLPYYGALLNAQWYMNPFTGQNGISYRNGLTSGFIPLASAYVAYDYGLIFDSNTGNMYLNIDRTGTLSAINLSSSFVTGRNSIWSGTPGRLTLNNFSWHTSAATALTIVGRATTLSLSGTSTFESMSEVASSCGIYTTNFDVTLEGSGTLSTKGRTGIDLGTGHFTLNSGSFISEGNQAIKWAGVDTGPYAAYYSWAYIGPNGSDSGYGSEIQFEFFATDTYVMLSTLEPVSFTAEQKGGVSELANSTGIELTFSKPVDGLTEDDITITDGTGSAVKGVLTGAGTTWTISLSRVEKEGTVSVRVEHFGEFFVTPNVQNDVDIYRGDVYDLIVVTVGSGTISGDDTGQYLKYSPISVTAVPDDGFEFLGWTIEGAVLTGENDTNPAQFDMPGDTVTLTANFSYDPDAAGGDRDVSHILNMEDHIRYMQGVGNNLFEPERNINRAEIAQLFYNLLIEQDVAKTKTFPDIISGRWYANAVDTLASLGIVTGYVDGYYQPERDMSRAEFIAVAVRFAKELPLEIKPASFSDVLGNHWAYTFIDAAVQFEWISGYHDRTFRPDIPISRSEVVTIVNRMLNRSADEVYIDHHPDLTRFNDVPARFWAYYGIMEAYHAHDYIRTRDGGESWIEID